MTEGEGSRAPAASLVVAILALAAAAPAAAQPAGGPAADTGFIGQAAAHLEIDDCPVADPTATEAQLTARFNALYDRGEVLYLQGDYPGAVREFISGYCLAGGFAAGRSVRYKLLKDIGQGHERSLDYEKAIGYFERFVADYPADADPADRRVVESRVTVLRKLRAHVFVETAPGGANITISNEAGVAGLGRSGKEIEVPGGTYTMLVELPGHESHTQQIEVRIGKPFAFFVPLRALRGRLSVQVTPPDAKLFLRDRSVERFVGVGRADEVLSTGTYVLVADAPGRVQVERPIEVLPDRVNRMQIDLALQPQSGRRQLIVFSTAGAAWSASTLLYAFRSDSISVLGFAVGAGAGLFGSYVYLPDRVPLGTGNLTITSGLAGAIAGIASTRLFTSESGYLLPIGGAGTLLGAGAGYYLGNRVEITPGDAALISSSVIWGTVVGGLFALSFARSDDQRATGDDDGRISAGLTLSGFGMGAVSGVLMARYYDVSRRRTVLVDIGGLIGLIGGIAVEGLAYPNKDPNADDVNEHLANFMLGGVALGLVGAAILTRNVDAPKIPVKPSVGTATDAKGASTALYGISGVW